MKSKEIVIGGAQFGSKYGINNKYTYKLSSINKNLSYLKSKNINCFDTSNLYKKSNQIIGKLNNDNRNKYYAKFYIDIKKLEVSKDKELYIKKFFNKIFKNLNTDEIYCLSFHRFNLIINSNQLILKYLLYLKKINKIKKIGVSISNYAELNKAINMKHIDLIQMPFNILDNRWKDLINNIHKARSNGKIFQVRSIFLQGLLLTDKKDLWLKANCADNSEIFKWIKKYLRITKSKNIKNLSIRYVNSIDWIDSIVIGFNAKQEIIENLNYFKNKKISNKLIKKIDKNKLKINNKILDPSKWKL